MRSLAQGWNCTPVGYFYEELPWKARLFILAVTFLGLPLFFQAVEDLTSQPPQAGWLLLLLVLLAVVSSLPGVRIPVNGALGGSVTTSVGDAFIFTAVVLFGPAAGILVAVAEGLAGSLGAGLRHLYKYLFNMGQLCLSAFLAGHLLSGGLWHRGRLPQGAEEWLWFFLCLLAAGSLYFLVNTGLVAAAVALSSGKSWQDVWRKKLFPASPVNVSNLVAVAVIFTGSQVSRFWFVLALVPVLVGMYYAREWQASGLSDGKQKVNSLMSLIRRCLFREPLTASARGLLVLVSGLGLTVFLYCLTVSLGRGEGSWVYLLLLTALVACFPIRIVFLKERLWVTGADVLVFAALLQYGLEVAVLAAVTEGLVFNLRRRVKHAYRQLYNLGQMALAAFLTGGTLLALWTATAADSGNLFLPGLVFLVGLFYFAVNSTLASLGAAWATNQPFWVLWSRSLPWAPLTLLGVSLGVLLGLYQG